LKKEGYTPAVRSSVRRELIWRTTQERLEYSTEKVKFKSLTFYEKQGLEYEYEF